MAGISGNGNNGAYSIVSSGGYEDDVETDDEIIYTGQGGRDQETGRQVFHQTLTRGNLALAKNHVEGIPLRVIKGNTKTGYTYDGLYSVQDYWKEPGQSGFDVWRFKLVRLAPDETIETTRTTGVDPVPPKRKETTVLRIIRDSELTRLVKKLYSHKCQVCGIRLDTPGGPYAEGAHIRPLGKGHRGLDVLSNILCLCPNHHVLFDNLAFSIEEDFRLVGMPGVLNVHPSHNISVENLKYHREHRFKGA